jgi:Zn-dependent protease with chaperone function
MELLWVRWVIIVIILTAVSFELLSWLSKYLRINVAWIIALIYLIVNLLYYFSPQLLTYVGYLHPTNDQKAVQLQQFFPDINYWVIQSSKYNATALSYGDNANVALTSKTLEEWTFDELLGVSAHELGHIQELHMVWETLLLCILYYLIILVYNKIWWTLYWKASLTIILWILWVLLYFWTARIKENHADIYAKNAWYWAGLASYFERTIETMPTSLGIGRKWFETIRYLHPPLEQRIKFLKDE